MPSVKLQAFLDNHNVKYETIVHSIAYTTQGIAALTHIAGKKLAKTVIVSMDGELAMAVLPACEHVDTHALKLATGAETVRLATEFEFGNRFPECETGAMPPFGNLYGMRVFVEESLTKDDEIVFNAGSHRELVRLSYRDFARLVQPTEARFSMMRVRAKAVGDERLW
jgi:Ala-tRNA(Pro) deacylase